MKTFEEAAKQILQPTAAPSVDTFFLRYECLTEDIKGCVPLATMIRSYQGEMKLCCLRHIMAEMDAAAKAFFHFGVAVGIEMTKVDE
jgi:hypothetical protein